MSKQNRTEFGRIVISDPGADRPLLEVGTLQCCHCGKHWVPRPGSGTVRGFCRNCMAPVCGPGCKECVPLEQMLDNLERGRPEDFRPVSVSLAPESLP